MTIQERYDEASSIWDSDRDKGVALLRPLLELQKTNKEAANELIVFIRRHEVPQEIGFEFLSALYEAHSHDEDVVMDIGRSLEAALDVSDLNAAPPDHPFFSSVLQSLSELSEKHQGGEREAEVAEALSSTARLMGREYDQLAEQQFARLVELLPDTSWAHYNQGLFYKTRGRFEEGVRSNQKAMELSEEDQEAYIWNLGICATGASMGDIALDMWKGIGNKIEMGRYGLPEGRYYSCKVKLSEFPLAERTAENNHPGLEETIWIQRLSPCHGIIRSVLYQDLGVDYGDVILFDGAPITYHTYGDDVIPVFPHLATLVRSNYHFYDFAAIQNEAGVIKNLDGKFEQDVVIYSHTDNYRTLCSACWRNEDLDHAKHTETEEKNIVTGRIAAPPEITSKSLLELIDELTKNRYDFQIYTPSLCKSAGLEDRAMHEKRRFDLLRD